MRTPSMTKMHFEFLATTLGELRGVNYVQAIGIAHQFADRLKATNGLFDRQRFVESVEKTWGEQPIQKVG